MAEKRQSGPRPVRLRVETVKTDPDGDGPFEIQGRMLDSGEPLRLIGRAPLAARPGDVLTGFAVLRPRQGEILAVNDDPFPPRQRLVELLESGAVSISRLPAFDLAERPAVSAWLGARPRGMIEAAPLPGATLWAPARDSEDGALAFIARLAEELADEEGAGGGSGGGTGEAEPWLAAIDPMAFAAIPARPPEARPGTPEGESRAVQSLYAELRLAEVAHHLLAPPDSDRTLPVPLDGAASASAPAPGGMAVGAMPGTVPGAGSGPASGAGRRKECRAPGLSAARHGTL